MRFLTPGEVGWGRKGCGDSTVPRDPTGRVYCTEVVVGPDRGVAGMAWGGQRRTEDTSASEEPLVLTVQFTRRPRWGDRGRRRDQDGVQGGSHTVMYRFSLERVSCNPGQPPTGCIDKDDLELLTVGTSRVLGWNPGLPLLGEFCPRSSSASPGIFLPLFFLFWTLEAGFHSVAPPSLELDSVLLPYLSKRWEDRDDTMPPRRGLCKNRRCLCSLSQRIQRLTTWGSLATCRSPNTGLRQQAVGVTVGGPEQASVHHGYCGPREHTGKGLIPGSTPSIATKGTHPGRTGCITLLNAYSSAVVPVSQPGPDVCVPEGTTPGPVGLSWGCVLELQPGFQNVPADFRQEHHGWSIRDAGTLQDCPQHTASRSPMWVWWALPGVPVDTAGSGGCLWTRLSLWSLVLLLQGVPEKKGTMPSTQGVTGMGGRQHSLSQSAAPGVIVTAGHSCLGTSFLWR